MIEEKGKVDKKQQLVNTYIRYLQKSDAATDHIRFRCYGYTCRC